MHPTQLNLFYPEHQEGLSLGQKFLHLAIFLHGSQRAGHNKTRPTGWATKAWTGQVTADALLVRGAHPGYSRRLDGYGRYLDGVQAYRVL
eukprot:s157_g13.t1